ncbi:MAG TPA: response regulator [Sulfuricurvum sp.]|nr:response regulator [Sulfuricurvum sp.]
MVYTDKFKEKFSASLGMLTSCAHLHSDPMVYTYFSGEIVGANSPFFALFAADNLSDVAPMDEWLRPQGVDLSFLLSQSNEYRGKVIGRNHEYDVAIRSEVILLENEPIVAVVLRDTSVIERARAAERYFERFKKKFLTSMSHEFRTPMNAIIGFVDLLKGSPLSSWQQEYADMANKSALSMMRNIENLLELMQVESGSIHSNLHPFQPIDVLESFSMQFNDLAMSKQLQWLVFIDPQLPKSIIGDQDKILAILRNLIQNAIKFTDEQGQVLLEVLVVNNGSKTIEVEYAISDTGIGIDSDHMKTLLRPFASAWENQRQGKDGLGIGLSLSHKYIDMMNSHLMLASEIGKGSRFSFRIIHPVHERENFESIIDGTRAAIYSQNAASAQSALLHKYLEHFAVNVMTTPSLLNQELQQCNALFLDVPHIAKSQIESLKTTYPQLQIIPILDSGHGTQADNVREVVGSMLLTLPLIPSSLYKVLLQVRNTIPAESVIEKREEKSIQHVQDAKILVAEDNLINLRLLETILLQNNFRVTTVDNGQKAVDAYLKEPFDLVLMDIDMPVMDGLTANRLIKEIDKRNNREFTPVIALTAHALIGDRERIIGAGLDAHLAKPIDKNFLLQTINRYLTMSHQKQVNKSV